MNILSLDLSTKSSGWAYFENGELKDHGCITSASTDLIKRIHVMIDSLREILNKNQIDKIYNKDLVFHAKYEKNELSSIYYYKNAVQKELQNIKEIPKSLLDIEKLNIYTNLDIDVQKNLENNI